jgi:hypothetical protein
LRLASSCGAQEKEMSMQAAAGEMLEHMQFLGVLQYLLHFVCESQTQALRTVRLLHPFFSTPTCAASCMCCCWKSSSARCFSAAAAASSAALRAAALARRSASTEAAAS